jgi:3-phytase
MKSYIVSAIALAITFGGCSNHNFLEVKAVAQTQHVEASGDVADDPAIWVDPLDSEKSLIVGTNKKGGGLEVYSLDGTRIQALKHGKFNNVDIRYGFAYNGTSTDIAVASNRDDNTLAIYAIDAKSHRLYPISLNVIPTVEKSYGLCMYQDNNDFYAITNNTNGKIIMQKIVFSSGKIVAIAAGEAQVASQPEGCVVDDATKTLYLGEEDVGIWRFDLSKGLQNNAVPFDTINKNSHLQADIEGLALYDKYLIASSQGNNSYALYERQSEKYLGSFVITDGEIDGTNDTDGIDATAVKLGKFTRGVFIAQDGSSPKGQNFKIIDFKDILSGLNIQ